MVERSGWNMSVVPGDILLLPGKRTVREPAFRNQGISDLSTASGRTVIRALLRWIGLMVLMGQTFVFPIPRRYLALQGACPAELGYIG
jgi:hypothetical protein